jgi:hypothetical protein
MSPEALVTVGSEVISTPSAPDGPSSGVSGMPYQFTAGGAKPSWGDPVQYSFNWGDGSSSEWAPSGVSSSSHAWSTAGAYAVTVQARSSTQPGVVSGVSAGLTVTITGGGPPPPTLATITPASGAQGTSVPVTLTGANFVTGATVAVSNTGVIVSNVAVVSTTQITATFNIGPTAALGATNVTVTTSGGTSGPAVFTVNPPAPTLTPPNALIVSDTSPGYQAVIASYLAAALQSAHYNVVTVTSVPGTIPVWNGTTGYKQVWDIRADLTVSLLGAEAASYSNYLIAGGSLFLAGENCTFAMSRDYDIAAFVSGVGGGAITPTDAGNSESVLPPFTTTPDAVTSITFLSAGGSSSPGTGSFIDQDTSPADGVGAGIVWPPGSLAGARAGTLIVVFDEDFIVNTGDPGSVAYLANLIGYLNSPAQ